MHGNSNSSSAWPSHSTHEVIYPLYRCFRCTLGEVLSRADLDGDFDRPLKPHVAAPKKAIPPFGDRFSERADGIVESGKSWLGWKGATVGSENLKPNIGSWHIIVIRVDSEPDNISIV